MRGGAGVTDLALSRWRAFHLYYHEQPDRLLDELVHPLVASLLARGEIDSFFFVRYFLGGPHVRLRVRLCGDERAVAEEIRGAAEQFFRTCPSCLSIPIEKIREAHPTIMALDPAETDDTIYPDNTVRSAPFVPESERYGGAHRLADSLAYFALSSCRALRWLRERGGDPGTRLSSALQHLGLWALALAGDEREALRLAHYPVASWELAPVRLVEKGDLAFGGQKDRHVLSLRVRIESLTTGGDWEGDLGADRHFEGTLRGFPGRLRILTSQLHMAANRLGLHNSEEFYLARLLWRVMSEVAAVEPELWKRLGERLALREQVCPMGDCLAQAFASLNVDHRAPGTTVVS